MSYKIGDIFFHPEQRVLVEISNSSIPATKFKQPNTDRDTMYDLKILNPNTGEKKPWKRYWKEKVQSKLIQLENIEAATVLFKENK